MQPGGLTEDERRRYDDRQRANMRPLIRFGIGAGLSMLAVHLSWDVAFDSPSAPTVIARLSCMVLLAALIPLLRWSLFRNRPELILYAGVTTSAIFVSLVASFAAAPGIYATGSLLLMILVISALAPSLRASMISSALLLTTFAVVAFARQMSAAIVESVSVFVGSGALIGCVMSEVRNRIRQRVFGLEVELERVARTDALSGVLSRRAFVDSANIEFQRAGRYGYSLAVLMIDVDHFKLLNDTHGHAVGDEAIRTLGETCRKMLRTSDLVGRMGGEEFAIVLPHTEAAAAEPLANRLREAIGAIALVANGNQVRFTVSVGVAMRASADERVLDTLSRADQALYDAKHAGRNRVMPARAA